MIGLALSMGASSLLLPRQDDGALASEPMSAESTTSVFPLAFEVAALPSGAEMELESAPLRMVRHSVREGETLWTLSRRYRVPVSIIAEANDISVDSVIQVGQTLKVPVPTRVQNSSTDVHGAAIESRETIAESANSQNSESQSLAPEVGSVAVEGDRSVADSSMTLKAERDESLQRLRQQRDKLRNSLVELRSHESEVNIEDAAPKTHAE
jgi:hypothetical protein